MDGAEAFDIPAACTPNIQTLASLTSTLAPDLTDEWVLNIQNDNLALRASSETGISQGFSPTALGASLDWTISEAPVSCDTPGDLPWVSLDSSNGSTGPGDISPVSVLFDSTGLSIPSSQTGLLCITSNDPDSPIIQIPLNLLVYYQSFYPTVQH